MQKKGKLLANVLSATLAMSSVMIPGSVVFAESDLEINETNFPDPNFRSAIMSFDQNGDGSLNQLEQLVIEEIKVKDAGISSLQGIELFPNLLYLNCNSNNLTEIDISKNPNLKSLCCKNNKLESIDVSQNKELLDLECDGNQLTSLDVSANTKLSTLTFDNNSISMIDVSHNPELYGLSFRNNNVSTIDVSHNPALGCLACDGNGLKELDISKNPQISSLSATNNSIATLDVSNTFISKPEWGWQIDSSENPSYRVGYETDKSIAFADDMNAMFPDKEVYDMLYNTFSKLKLDENTEVLYYSYIFAFDKATVVTGAGFDVTKTTMPQVNGTVANFAERLYTTCLGRPAEVDGKDYWASVLKSGMTGAEVAAGFFFSLELEAKNLSNEDYIKSLYETFMGRTPAAEEVAYWASEMNNGKDKRAIFDGFVNSTEWADICLGYGIKSGGLAQPSYVKAPSAEVLGFAERLYSYCLFRAPEPDGLVYWAIELANLRSSGTEAARGFFFSQEFIDFNLSNEDFVARLYFTFMDRDPEQEGFEYWVGQLNAGESRESVFNNFTVAQEFADICANAGIMR